MHPSLTLSLLSLVLAVPFAAGSNVIAPTAAEAAKRPRVAAVLAARERMDVVAIAGDTAAIDAALAPDMILNGPNNRTNDKASILANVAAGRLTHGSLERTIEYAAERGQDVILMGKETAKPRDSDPNGKTRHRRFTDIWTETPQGWKLVLRHATIYATE